MYHRSYYPQRSSYYSRYQPYKFQRTNQGRYSTGSMTELPANKRGIKRSASFYSEHPVVKDDEDFLDCDEEGIPVEEDDKTEEASVTISIICFPVTIT